MRVYLTVLEIARRRAKLFRSMLPTAAQANDPDSFTQEDLDVMLEATQCLDPTVEDLRMGMVVKLKIYWSRYVDAITGRQKCMPDQTQQLVDDLTRGWDQFRITRPPPAREPFPNMDRHSSHLKSDGSE